MSSQTDDKLDKLIRNLVRSKNYYALLIKEIDRNLKKLSKEYEIIIPLDE